MVEELKEDMDRICYWTLLETDKYLGYDISRSLKLYYLEDGKTLTNGLKVLATDTDVLELAN